MAAGRSREIHPDPPRMLRSRRWMVPRRIRRRPADRSSRARQQISWQAQESASDVIPPREPLAPESRRRRPTLQTGQTNRARKRSNEPVRISHTFRKHNQVLPGSRMYTFPRPRPRIVRPRARRHPPRMQAVTTAFLFHRGPLQITSPCPRGGRRAPKERGGRGATQRTRTTAANLSVPSPSHSRGTGVPACEKAARASRLAPPPLSLLRYPNSPASKVPLPAGLEQNTVLGILRLHGPRVQGSAPAASREGVTKIPDELNRCGSPTDLARRPLVAHNILST
jgi:hypothetical protein